ncbi:Uncharacterised protein [Klebsiella oxytoca]|nr:hypothetical protein [Klebsiella oxytoca]MCW9476765.1 hypothetical protein [Klebsiella oxytoca]MCW9493198.1 hypothetical protein [Klebsiella oxytoca]MDM4086394.1 hypothetical protein [Klebsiella oxytoca]SBL38175.1 Uncharacterised protein [Klebsiella oxytoca]SBL48395.1 Uncharacterised protein [Klebsiella oxytoca]
MTDNTTEELKEIFQKISKKVVKLIPYLTILSSLMVWSYLNNIGRLDLLIDSFSINIGLVSLLISAVVLSLAIAITLILPSSILIFHSSMFPNIINKPISIPWLGWGFSTLFLALTFLPHIPSIEKIISPPSALLIFIIIAVISFIIFITISCRNGDFKNKGIFKIAQNIGKALIETFTTVFATLSIAIPITFLLKNSTGEKPESLLIALAFMIAFALSSFLPAIIYYRDMKNTSNNERKRLIPLAKNLSLAVIITITITSLLFPNVTTTLMNSSLYSIGVIDNKNHYFLIDGEKYKPDMFPKKTWRTSTTEKIGTNFFIYGIRMFSAGSKNLICPDSVGSFKTDINGTNYDLITSSDSKDNTKKLKDMTKSCVVLDSDNAQQWDTFFENNDQDKG